MNIFERAARAKLRFPSPVGDLTVEHLFDLPLQDARARVDLDTVARGIYQVLKDVPEVSFVDDAETNPARERLELQFEIVKHVIETKKAARAAAQKAAETAERKRRLLAALASKEEAELVGMSREEIEAEIAKLAA